MELGAEARHRQDDGWQEIRRRSDAAFAVCCAHQSAGVRPRGSVCQATSRLVQSCSGSAKGTCVSTARIAQTTEEPHTIDAVGGAVCRSMTTWNELQTYIETRIAHAASARDGTHEREARRK